VLGIFGQQNPTANDVNTVLLAQPLSTDEDLVVICLRNQDYPLLAVDFLHFSVLKELVRQLLAPFFVK
jgi:hypothetical protein